jgi:hypothetical protein
VLEMHQEPRMGAHIRVPATGPAMPSDHHRPRLEIASRP